MNRKAEVMQLRVKVFKTQAALETVTSLICCQLSAFPILQERVTRDIRAEINHKK